VAGQAYAGIELYLEKFSQVGAGDIHLAGSGPCLFSMFDSREGALAVQGRLSQINMHPVLVPGVTRDEAGY
jgi:4-diphosphocytidyl-2C-methyl-D-erythritol kinase